MPSIVNETVNQIVAPTPSKLQGTGALISQGGTTLTSSTKSLLTQLADLNAILKAPAANTSLTWLSSVVTVTTATPHGLPMSETLPVTIAGAVPTAYNGSFQATVTGTSTFTYALVSNPGTSPASTPGTWVPGAAAALLATATTFFSQGASVGVYVLELGPGIAADGVTTLDTYIENNPNFFYSYLVPKGWSSESTFLTFIEQFQAPLTKTYFFVTMTTGNYTNFPATNKCVIGMIEAPGTPSTEHSIASEFWVTLHYNPSGVNRVPPLAFTFVFAVTPYPTQGNEPLLTALKAAGVNYIGTGAEGGISDTIVLWGTTMDVRPFNYWYSVDWVKINGDLAVANAVINGSNNTINPLYFEQPGINRLQKVLAQTMTSGVTFGLVLGTVVQTGLFGTDLIDAIDNGNFAGQCDVNAIPFIPYLQANPSDYKTGTYNGLSVIFTPLRGFDQIGITINVTDFVAGGP